MIQRKSPRDRHRIKHFSERNYVEDDFRQNDLFGESGEKGEKLQIKREKKKRLQKM